jgi:protoheme ferro-lyase
MTTIGESVNKKAEDYFKMYKQWRVEKPIYAKTQEQAEALAEYDLIQQKIITEFALNKLHNMIRDYEATEALKAQKVTQ